MQGIYPNNFLALDRELSDYGKAKVAVLPIAYDATVSYGSGARNGPRAIISASSQVEFYDHDFRCEPCQAGIATLEEIQQQSSGPEAMMTVIESAAREIIGDGKFLMALGGEHSISFPLVKAHRRKYPDLTVLQIDAHSDQRDEYQGSIYSHACVMSRIGEICPFVTVGARSFCDSENERRAFKDDRIIRPREIRGDPKTISNVLSMLSSDIYITFDVDGLDPSVMPAVGTPEPGGLFWDETIDFLMKVGREKRIVGGDVVELAPIPGLIYPDFTAARLVYKIISIALRGLI